LGQRQLNKVGKTKEVTHWGVDEGGDEGKKIIKWHWQMKRDLNTTLCKQRIILTHDGKVKRQK
jgi:hypothetical protein